jgi:hypothetical protein
MFLFNAMTKDIEKIETIIKQVFINLKINIEDNAMIACYGSLATNTMNDFSDIDLLYIHNQKEGPRRLSAALHETSVTVYAISRDDFFQDGHNKFGGFFCVKLFNPCVIFPDNKGNRHLIRGAIGEFFGAYAAELASLESVRIFKREQLLKHVIKSYFAICPGYASYFLRYYMLDNFTEIWKLMSEEVEKSFLQVNVVKEHSPGMYQYAIVDRSVQERKVLSIARFWAFGVSSHNNDYNFPDKYFFKSKEYIEKNQLQEKYYEMLAFLSNEV